jgi:ParB-like chromosome segregation protein Spo0J
MRKRRNAIAKQTVVAIPGNHHYRAVPSPRARAAGIDRRTLRRALAVVESHERLAAEVQQMADAAAKAIRKRGNRLNHAAFPRRPTKRVITRTTSHNSVLSVG